MIKIEKTVLASPEQMIFIIEGMRNPMNSWDRSDSKADVIFGKTFNLGENDEKLMRDLALAGSVHRKYMRMMPVYVRITAPLYWWKEFDTYKVGTVSNSCSTMHKIHAKEFTEEDFSCEHIFKYNHPVLAAVPELKYWEVPGDILSDTIKCLNFYRQMFLENHDKKFWWQMIQLLPSSYNQTRNVMMNYETLRNIYHSPRWNHKLDEWREFCEWIKTLPYSELITEKPSMREKIKGVFDRLKDLATSKKSIYDVSDVPAWLDDMWEEFEQEEE